MPEPSNDTATDMLLGELYPLARQAARIFSYLADFPESLSRSDLELSSRVGEVSSEHVAIVRRSLLKAGLAKRSSLATELVSSATSLRNLAENLKGIAAYLRIHIDRNSVQLVLTEPGERSALREAVDGRSLSPILFQTSDAFFHLARAAKRRLMILAPFIDNQGAALMVELFEICGPEVQRILICRPLSESHCGPAFNRRAADFKRLNVSVYEYAIPSQLPSGRETFHAKIVLVDDSEFYVGSSNFMGSALERSFECGVIVRGDAARELSVVLDALRSIAKPPHIFS
jgi:phosphatidylserine/phosphatidylglycerophosphate/cardiolipin synthase-like enzyme